MSKLLVLILPFFVIGCASHTYEVKVKYEYYVAADIKALEHIYTSIKPDVSSNPKSEFVLYTNRRSADVLLNRRRGQPFIISVYGCYSVLRRKLL